MTRNHNQQHFQSQVFVFRERFTSRQFIKVRDNQSTCLTLCACVCCVLCVIGVVCTDDIVIISIHTSISTSVHPVDQCPRAESSGILAQIIWYF